MVTRFEAPSWAKLVGVSCANSGDYEQSGERIFEIKDGGTVVFTYETLPKLRIEDLPKEDIARITLGHRESTVRNTGKYNRVKGFGGAIVKYLGREGTPVKIANRSFLDNIPT